MGLEEEDAIETERGGGELLPARVQTWIEFKESENLKSMLLLCNIIFDELD